MWRFGDKFEGVALAFYIDQILGAELSYQADKVNTFYLLCHLAGSNVWLFMWVLGI